MSPPAACYCIAVHHVASLLHPLYKPFSLDSNIASIFSFRQRGVKKGDDLSSSASSTELIL